MKHKDKLTQRHNHSIMWPLYVLCV